VTCSVESKRRGLGGGGLRSNSAAADLPHVGSMVECTNGLGIGRVGQLEGAKVRVDYFESVADPVAESCWVEGPECNLARLQDQTRIYWQDPDTGNWEAGRIVGGDRAEYFVRFPNSKQDRKIPEAQLRVRWDRPVRNPVDVLVAGASDSAYHSDTRAPMMRSLVAQRAACGSAFALLSAGIEIFPHQVHAAMTVISDPIQRYLLADEVGLGKTLEAGLVIRQVLLDEPMSKIVVITPDALRRQWRDELTGKLLIGDFPFATVKISSHETPEMWRSYRGYDLLVVDEANQLAQVKGPSESPYRELAELAHSVPRVLLLSATPLTSRITTHLGLLHLLDPDLYRWTDREAFEERFRLRKHLANAVFQIDADFESFLPSAVSDVEELIPHDQRFRELSLAALSFLTEDGDLRAEDERAGLAVAVEALRAHISETYRLHRRMIRHRRKKVMLQNDEAATQPYGLTGRTRPQPLVLDSSRQWAVQDALLNWQSGIANWLMDEGREADAKAYGQALGVLVSRTDSASADLADALRWRLNRDSAAAERAGLTHEERVLLSAPPAVPLEKEVLGELPSGPDGDELAKLAGLLRSGLDARRRVIVFCGPGTLAAHLANAMRRGDPRLHVAEHTRRVGMEDSDAAVVAWRKDGGILVADDSAEEGLNLQAADAVVHWRLPWSPNQLEQRIGRVDRYHAGASRQPAEQVVSASPEGEYTLPGAWLTLLDQAFGIFSQSVSALQDTIDQGLASIWEAAVLKGPEGLNDLTLAVSDDLKRELREIDELDMLEEIHDAQTGMVNIAVGIGDLEADWRVIEAATTSLAGGRAGGLRFAEHAVGPGGKVTQFERATRPPLVPPRILARGGTHLKPEMMRGAFNRAVALKEPGTRVLRAGNPFIDMLASTVWIDDRGQATAFLRRDPLETRAFLYYGFDFLVEANIEAALVLVGDDPVSCNALRRQADCLLAPFTRRVWVQGPGKTVVEHEGQLAWLNRPYKSADNGGPDINLNPQRIGPLLDRFGGRDGFATDARSALEAARNQFGRVTGLPGRCEEARQRAASVLAVRRAQAEARKAAGRIVADTESYAADVAIADALISGLVTPIVKVISVTCLVRGMLQGVTRA
jgi:ATP-dependent helicase HepA